MATFFTSDTHFGHSRLANNGSRPFRDTAAMDHALITRWNEVVSHDDDVWHLGDFSAYRDGRLDGVFHRLNGRKHLIIGNHDEENEAVLALPWEKPPEKHLLIHVAGEPVFLCHYPVLSWPRMRDGALHLFGHMHSNVLGTRASIDVGVDAWDYRPVSLEVVRRRMRAIPARRDLLLDRA